MSAQIACMARRAYCRAASAPHVYTESSATLEASRLAFQVTPRLHESFDGSGSKKPVVRRKPLFCYYTPCYA